MKKDWQFYLHPDRGGYPWLWAYSIQKGNKHTSKITGMNSKSKGTDLIDLASQVVLHDMTPINHNDVHQKTNKGYKYVIDLLDVDSHHGEYPDDPALGQGYSLIPQIAGTFLQVGATYFKAQQSFDPDVLIREIVQKYIEVSNEVNKTMSTFPSISQYVDELEVFKEEMKRALIHFGATHYNFARLVRTVTTNKSLDFDFSRLPVGVICPLW